MPVFVLLLGSVHRRVYSRSRRHIVERPCGSASAIGEWYRSCPERPSVAYRQASGRIWRREQPPASSGPQKSASDRPSSAGPGDELRCHFPQRTASSQVAGQRRWNLSVRSRENAIAWSRLPCSAGRASWWHWGRWRAGRDATSWWIEPAAKEGRRLLPCVRMARADELADGGCERGRQSVQLTRVVLRHVGAS